MKDLTYTICFTIAFFTITVVKAQHSLNTKNKMQYTYDASGNRIMRKLVLVTFQKRGVMPIDTMHIDTLVCNDTSSFITADVLATQNSDSELEKEVRPNVYPNPTASVLSIELLANIYKLKPDMYTIQLHDNKNALVYQSKVATIKTEIDIHELAPGIYNLTIQSDKKNYFFTIQKINE